MNDTAIGEFVESLCPFCERPIPRQDAFYPGLVYLDFRRPAHKTCREARYQDRDPFVERPTEPVQAQLSLFDNPEPAEAATAFPGASAVAPAAKPDGAQFFLWFRDDTKTPVAQKVAEAVELYAARHGQEPNVCLVHENDWRRSDIAPGEEIVPGVRLFVSGYVHEFEFKVGRHDEAGS